MGKAKKTKKTEKHISINISKSDLASEKNTFTDFKKRTLGVLRHFEEEDYKKCLEIEMYQEGTHYMKIDRDKLKEENDKLKARNEFLEKNNGDKQIQHLHNELKKDHLTEARKEEIKNEYDEKRKAFFESHGIIKYLNDPKLSQKKKQKS